MEYDNYAVLEEKVILSAKRDQYSITLRSVKANKKERLLILTLVLYLLLLFLLFWYTPLSKQSFPISTSFVISFWTNPYRDHGMGFCFVIAHE
jgi:hypothetical protein